MKTLQELAKEKAKGMKLLNVYLELYKLWVGGQLVLKDPSPPLTFRSYLTRLDYSAWLWTLLSLSLITVTLVTVTEGGVSALLPLRYVFGALTVLFLPGYAIVEALYPKGEELSPLERLALSIGLSLAVVPLIGLILNYTPIGIRLYPVLTSLSILTCTTAFIGAYRKHLYVSLTVKGVKVGARS
ncbi:MAG: DUF1616 domain-containing protein [Thermofilaceae archaeon]|nr:DUF1616 domain-containing protein [Thermofilaceae archaeon]MCX8181413.1 DUF1616 domain-containing protein [Thermofilaceae archaeon]